MRAAPLFDAGLAGLILSLCGMRPAASMREVPLDGLMACGLVFLPAAGAAVLLSAPALVETPSEALPPPEPILLGRSPLMRLLPVTLPIP